MLSLLMTPHEFIRKWRPVALTERQTAQEHFIDLCCLVSHPTPIEDDPSGERFCFEKGALKSSGNPGYADVWKKGYFAFEYKKKRKNLGEALKQLSQYAWNLENPPLNVVCDTNLIRIVTAWTNTPSKTFDLSLDDLAEPEKFAILHAVFHDPEKLRGHMTREMLTKEAADKFSGLAQRFQSRGHAPAAVAHFVMQLVFCFFAEDVRLLPEGFFRKALRELNVGNRHRQAKSLLDDMFRAMAEGGRVGNEFVAHFNGGLFNGQMALPLDEGDLGLLVAVGSMQWAEIDPSIFGTLFERFLDPAKRAQIGAHYTDAKKIVQIVDPVVMRPLEAEWTEVKSRIETLVSTARGKGPKAKEWVEADLARTRFVDKLASLRILDPACGSGNFLYMALHRVSNFASTMNARRSASNPSRRASVRRFFLVSRSTGSPPKSRARRSGSAIFNGACGTRCIRGRSRFCASSTRSNAGMRFSRSRPMELSKSCHGRRLISSSVIRRFWARRKCCGGWV